MKPLSEGEARQVLTAAKSQASSPDLFEARREEGGWAFGWADKTKRIPFGVRTWVVTDSGQAAMVRLGESAGEALKRLAN